MVYGKPVIEAKRTKYHRIPSCGLDPGKKKHFVRHLLVMK
jgi:hypothetical protein